MSQDHCIIPTIQKKLRELEELYDIKVLFACESGSRAWGFPSLDSDYDVRFIYAHPLNWYLTVEENRDVIELPINPELDINGWELRKALRLMMKNNAALNEWLQSPIVYRQENSFISTFSAAAPSLFSPLAAMHHYLSISQRYFSELMQEEKIKLKKYFYCLRSNLAALWIGRNRTIPPMELRHLLSMIEGRDLLIEKIHSWVILKSNQNESDVHPHDEMIDEFLSQSLTLCNNIISTLPSPQKNVEVLNQILRAML